jgi:hypothetical protein
MQDRVSELHGAAREEGVKILTLRVEDYVNHDGMPSTVRDLVQMAIAVTGVQPAEYVDPAKRRELFDKHLEGED